MAMYQQCSVTLQDNAESCCDMPAGPHTARGRSTLAPSADPDLLLRLELHGPLHAQHLRIVLVCPGGSEDDLATDATREVRDTLVVVSANSHRAGVGVRATGLLLAQVVHGSREGDTVVGDFVRGLAACDLLGQVVVIHCSDGLAGRGRVAADGERRWNGAG